MAYNYNNPPLSTLIHGNLTLEKGSDVEQFGFGDLNVERRGYFYGTENATNATTGTVTVYGGIGVAMDAWIDRDTTVLGITRLKSTFIDTSSNGGVYVTGANSVSISVGEASQFVATGGNLTLDATTERIYVTGGKNDSQAVNITATHVDGGIDILSGITNGGVKITTGAGGIYETASNGNIVLTAHNGDGEFIVNSQVSRQDLHFAVNGVTDSQVLIESEGINTSVPAIQLKTTNTSGNILIENTTGLGAGEIRHLTGSGGFHVTTNTGGQTALTTQSATAEIKVLSANPGDNIVLNMQNPTDSSIVIKSEGISTTRDAISIQTVHTGGNIHIYNTDGSMGYIHLDSGRGGYQVVTQQQGTIVQTANGATSTYRNITTADGQDLYINVTGGTMSRVVLQSDGTGVDSIKLHATAATGGIYAQANGPIELSSQHFTDGVKIATDTEGIPVKIGTSTSVTTIYGDLNVKGVTTTVESTVVTIDDNIIFVNSAPEAISDGGLGIKRYQFANDVSGGEVVSDTPDATGTARGGSSSTITLALNDSSVDDFYAGWWLKIVSGTGTGQVRRIKSYNGTTKIATIYTTADQTGLLKNPVPLEGLDFTTAPDSSSVYNIYPCTYVLSIWDESENEFAFVCAPITPGLGNTNFVHYSDLHINDLTANNLFINTINGTTADRTIYVTLNDNSLAPVTVPEFNTKFGIFIVLVTPVTNSSRTSAVFVLGRVNSVILPGQVVRIVSVKGLSLEQLDMQWPANEYPQFLYRLAPGFATQTQYKVRIITV